MIFIYVIVATFYFISSVFRGLKKIITPLFAGLMEVDPQRMWNFDRFFQEVTAIVIIADE